MTSQPPPPPQQQQQTGQAPKRRSSLESAASVIISGPAARNFDAANLEPDVIEVLPQFELYDAASVIVECPKHKTFAFRKIGSKKELWFPTAVVSRVNGFEASIKSKLKQLLSHPDFETGHIPFTDLKEIQYSRIQCPVVNLFVTRALFRTSLIIVKVKGENGKEEEVCCENTFTMEWLNAKDISEMYVHKFWGPEPLILTPKGEGLGPLFNGAYTELSVSYWSGLTTADENECKTAGYVKEDIALIYADFLQHCYPSCYMTSESLLSYLIKSGMIETESNMPVRIKEVFWPPAEKRICLTFSQLVGGLAQIDADNTKTPGKKGNRTFVKCAASNDRMAYPIINDSFSEVTSLTRAIPDKCPKCTGPVHMIANHSCSIKPDGTLNEFVEQSLADNVPIPVFERDLQYNLADDRWCVNQMIQWTYDHAFVNEIPTGPFELPNVNRKKTKAVSLWSLNKDELYEMIIRLCDMVKLVLMKDNRLVDMMDPCYVIGSLHGSLGRLLELYGIFWRQGIAFESANYVFLGNFSGAGGQSQSLECLLYLFALKCSAPSKVALIRGKAENRSSVPTFAPQLSQNFGGRANKLIDSIYSVFDVMPIACLINGWEVCTSGGLPDRLSSLDELNRVPINIPETDGNLTAKGCVDPVKVSPDLMTRMRNIHINSLITGTPDANAISQFSSEPVYRLSSTSNPTVVLFSDEKKIPIQVVPKPPANRTKS
jgi:hypothetical protein